MTDIFRDRKLESRSLVKRTMYQMEQAMRRSEAERDMLEDLAIQCRPWVRLAMQNMRLTPAEQSLLDRLEKLGRTDGV